MKAIYPGSFDPFTNGHLDILQRSLGIFTEVIILVAGSSRKQTLFSVAERVALIQAVVDDLPGAMGLVKVDSTPGLIMEYARAHHVSAVIRGLRSPSDFEYEYMMSSMNKNVHPECETVFMMTSQGLYFVSSTMIKELYFYGGDISDYVPRPVYQKIHEKFPVQNGGTP